MKQTNELLKTIIDSISVVFTADDLEIESPGVYIFNTCDTLWVTPGKVITINGNDYNVIDISPNKWIKFTGTVDPLVLTFNVYTPFFWYGTVLAQQQQLDMIADSEQKLPMIWLHEITKESFTEDKTKMLDRRSDCDLYFMVDANFTDWMTKDHNRYAIQPMRNLIEGFIQALRDAINVTTVFSYDILDHAKFGVYLESKGHVNNIFNDKLSGSQLRITIPFLKDLTCTDCN